MFCEHLTAWMTEKASELGGGRGGMWHYSHLHRYNRGNWGLLFISWWSFCMCSSHLDSVSQRHPYIHPLQKGAEEGEVPTLQSPNCLLSLMTTDICFVSLWPLFSLGSCPGWIAVIHLFSLLTLPDFADKLNGEGRMLNGRAYVFFMLKVSVQFLASLLKRMR